MEEETNKTLLKTSFSEELWNKKWTKHILYCFKPEQPEKVLTWTDIKRKITKKLNEEKKKKKSKGKEGEKIVLIDDRALSSYLNTLCERGLLKKHTGRKRGYSLPRERFLNYIFKVQDKDALDGCPFNAIHPIYLPYEELEEEDLKKLERVENKKIKTRSVDARYLTIYGLRDTNNDFFKKISEDSRHAAKKIRRDCRAEYVATFLRIVDRECMRIKNKNIINCIKEWATVIVDKKGLLHPTRNWGENKLSHYPRTLAKIKLKLGLSPTESLKAEELAVKIMSKLESLYPPIVIVFRF